MCVYVLFVFPFDLLVLGRHLSDELLEFKNLE